MTVSSGIPKHVEEALSTHRRGFLKSAGLLVVSFATGSGALVTEAVAQNRTVAPSTGPYPDPDFRQLDSWISFMRTIPPLFMWAKPISDRVPEPVSGN